MQLKAMSPYFIMKVPKKDETEKREKIGNVYIHPSFVWMTRNTQCGIIHDISKEAANQLPEAKMNDILITHHFSQGSHSSRETDKRFFVYDDEVYNYYIITSKEGNGQNNQTYGVWDREKITPHKEYIFLEYEMPIIELKEENSVIESVDWKQTSEDIVLRLEAIKKDTEMLTKGKLTPEIVRLVQSNENEQMRLNHKLHEQKYLPYKVAYSNPSSSHKSGDIVYCLNIAAATSLEFNGKEYRIIEVKHIVATH